MVRRSRGQKELSVARRLQGVGVPTASVLAVGEKRTGGILRFDCIITEALADVTPLDDFLLEQMPKLPVAVRHALRLRGAAVLAMFVRRLHDSGVLHGDFHSGNVLVRRLEDGRREFVLVDLHMVRCGSSLGLGARMGNLAVFNRFFSLTASRTDRLRFWTHYVRGIPYLEGHRHTYARLLEEHTVRSRERFWRRRQRRCMRTNKYFRRVNVRGYRGHTVCGRWEFHDAVLESLPRGRLSLREVTVIKESRTTTVWQQDFDAGPGCPTLVIKRYNPRHGLRLLKTFCRPSRALHNWKMAYALEVRHVPAVRALAVFERRFLGLTIESLLVTRKVEDAGCLHEFIAREFAGRPSAAKERLRRRMTRELAGLVRLLHDRGFSHRDLKFTNVLVRVGEGDDPTIEFTLIDLDGLRQHRWVGPRRRARDLARLGAEFARTSNVRPRDRLRFLREYLRDADVGPFDPRRFRDQIERRIRKKLERCARKRS
jgi:tRNA A-37 threonylcarbamoyl transferase component Bud32